MINLTPIANMPVFVVCHFSFVFEKECCAILDFALDVQGVQLRFLSGCLMESVGAQRITNV